MGEGESRGRRPCPAVALVAVHAPFMLLCRVGEFLCRVREFPGQGTELCPEISSAVRFDTP